MGYGLKTEISSTKIQKIKENEILKKKILGLLVTGVLAASTLTGCSTEVERVNYNLTQQADNFNVVRRLHSD